MTTRDNFILEKMKALISAADIEPATDEEMKFVRERLEWATANNRLENIYETELDEQVQHLLFDAKADRQRFSEFYKQYGQLCREYRES